ncbi:MAG: L-2-amino-thiazoline-4-carboxylic acid hydrolase [Proteobacteria bacterium]|nr:L-2-amino-thiazoline-4-carboxylic acid hydrolase [Pseudomonadota bacterium]
MDEPRLIEELRESFANRAMLYHLIFEELASELGSERAAEILGRAVHRRGEQVGRRLFARTERGRPAAVAAAFLAASPAGGALFPTQVAHAADGSVEIRVRRCPLLEAWREAGLADAKIARLCAIAGRFDHGLFAPTGVTLAAATWQPGAAGCCRLVLRQSGDNG